jgi:hypothetical protein
MPESEWGSLDAILPVLLAEFKLLRKLEIEGVRWRGLMPEKAKDAFRAVFSLPSLVHVPIANVDLPRLGYSLDYLHPRLKRETIGSSIRRYTYVPNVIYYRYEKRQPRQLEYLRLKFLPQPPWPFH